MPFQVSPGVVTNEIDLTTIVPAVSTTEGALAGVFRWGPIEHAQLVSSEIDLVNNYGSPTSSNFETFFTAASFLAYGNKLYISRAAANCFNALAGPSYTNTSNSAITIKNEDDHIAQGDISNTGANYFVAKWAGNLGNSLKVSVCDSATAYQSTLTGAANNAFAFKSNPGSNVVTFTVTNSGSDLASANTAANTALSSLAIGDYIALGNTTIGFQFAKVTAKTTATAANSTAVQANVSIAQVFTLSSNVSQSSADRYWEFYNVVDTAPGTTSYTSNFGGSGDELHIVVVDEDGKFSGTTGTVLEVWKNLSRATNALGEEGGSIYYKNVIDSSSRYLWWGADRAGSPSNTAINMATLTTAPLTMSFQGGADGYDETTIPVMNLAKAYDVYKSSETIDISLILQGKARGGVLDTQLANYIIDNIAEYRHDCVLFLSPRREAVVSNFGAVEQDVVAVRNQLRSTSYAFMDSGYKYMYDKYNDVYRFVPLNGDIAGLAVRTDNTRDPWWSPAGFNRGQIKNIVRLAWNPDYARRDILYKSNVNPVVTFPGEGTVLYGDKTLLTKPSAFDRINVRRLFIVLEKAISTAAKYTLFEFNDEFTRAQFRNLVEPFLRDVQGRRGIYDFKVVCDTTNNTPYVIDSNGFVGDIYIKPARSINFITLNFVATPTGVQFDEIVGKF